MFDRLKKIFSSRNNEDIPLLVRGGAQVIDVRSREEFASGHLKGSVNIPLPEINRSLNKIRKDTVVIVCCASGMRSASAKSTLEARGYTVYNGGGWKSLERKMR